MPVIVLGTGFSASIARMTRASMLEIKNADFVLTARSKGLNENVVIFRHILKNALIPIITAAGMQLGAVLGGAAVMMFASILISGIQLITKEPIGSREITIISVAIGLGYGLGATNGATSQLPYYIQLVFGGSGIVPCSLAAILLNIILPKNSKPVRKMWDIDDEE